MFWLTLIAFLVILGLLIFAHELGHFLVAKASGVKVEEFAFGFPPRIFCKKRGETEYCINLVPFGGYVKMLGEEEKSTSPRSFSQKKARFKLLIVVAGVVMNFILAGILFSAGYKIGMSPIRLNPDSVSGQKTSQILVAQVNDNSPAARSGLQVGDQVLGFESPDTFSEFTRDNAGNTVSIKYERKGQDYSANIDLSNDSEAPLGVGVVNIPSVKLGFFQAISAGFKEMVLTTGYIFVLLKDIFVNIFTQGKVGEAVAGPVGIFNLTGEAVRLGIVYIIQLAAILSINLGIVNILPFPALDGGRAVFILSEGIFRKRIVKEEVENILHFIGFAILIMLILAITIKEVIALF